VRLRVREKLGERERGRRRRAASSSCPPSTWP